METIRAESCLWPIPFVLILGDGLFERVTKRLPEPLFVLDIGFPNVQNDCS